MIIGWCAIGCQLMFAFVFKNTSLNFVCMCAAITSFILSSVFAFIEWQKADKEFKRLMATMEEEMEMLVEGNTSECNDKMVDA